MQKSKEDDYTTGCLLDYPYFKKCKLIAVDLSEKKAMQQINFTGNLEWAGNTAMFVLVIIGMKGQKNFMWCIYILSFKSKK